MRQRARDRMRQYEAMRWDLLPWRARLVGAVAYPKETLRVASEWFAQVTVLPGEQFEDFPWDLSLTVVSVKPGVVICDAVSKFGRAADRPAERRAYARRPFGFWL